MNEILVAVVVEVARVDAHAGFRIALAVHGGAVEERHVLEPAVLLVHPELVRHAVVADVDVEPAVVVEVGRRHAERRAVRASLERLSRDIDERTVPPIAVQLARLGTVTVRRTVVVLPGHGQTVDVAFERVQEIVADEQIEPAVTIDVDKR